MLCCCWSEAVMFMEQHGYGGGWYLLGVGVDEVFGEGCFYGGADGLQLEMGKDG